VISIDRLRELFEYDAANGELFRRGTKKRASWIRRDGYRLVGVDYHQLLVHRVIWAMAHGQWPKNEIDHRDGNPSNNLLSNLRPASHRENLRNRGRPSNNTSGIKGVSWSKQKRRWWVKIGQKHIGFFADLEQARVARHEAERQHYGEFGRPS
jgi:hypothetical protein